MKIYIHANNNIKYEYNPDTDIMIDIDIAFYSYEKVAAALSTIKKIRFNDNTIDEQALAEYETFVKEILMEIETRGFVEVESHPSPESRTSTYHVFAYLNQEKSTSLRGLIFLRISDHKGTPTEYQKQKHINDRNEIVKRYRAKKWWEPEIVVNGDTYDSYDSAVDDVCEMIEKWIRKIRK